MLKKENIVSNFVNEQIINIPHILNNKISPNNKTFNKRLEIENIKTYINNFINNDVINRFIVLPGIRNVGKTTILYQIYDYLLKEKNIPSKQILYFSCEDLNDLVECSVRELVEIYLKDQFDTNLYLLNRKVFILIDESQYDKNWSLSGKIIYDKCENIFMIFTGSSALNLEYNADSARRMLKKTINPLNYTEHIYLKYNLDLRYLSISVKDLIFTGNIDDAISCEKKANTELINTIEYSTTDWNEYFKFGGFPTLFDKENLSKLRNISKKVVESDMIQLKNFSKSNIANANRILHYLALQEPGETSQAKLSNFLQTSSLNIKNILDILEKTHLIFHTEPYSTSSKRITKSWKYYFTTCSLRNALSTSIGNTYINSSEYKGILLENLVGSSLFNLSIKLDNAFNIFYDAEKKSNVDFIIRSGFENPIPIEVGKGRKDKRQIKRAINKYNANYGIVVSNKTKTIKKEDDVIFIPPKTFSFL